MLMSLPSYYAYLARQVDEEPLYVFDATFGESTPQLLQAYSVPACFGQDYYAALGARRPDYRWLVTGPGELGAGAAWRRCRQAQCPTSIAFRSDPSRSAQCHQPILPPAPPLCRPLRRQLAY